MTSTWQRALRPRRRVQRPHRGERRRHARRPGLRQRGPRAPPVRRATTQRYRATKLEAYRLMAASMSLSYLEHAAHADRRHDRRRLVRPQRRRSATAGSSASSCSSASSSARSRRSTPSSRPTPRASPASGATPNSSTPSPTSSTAPGAIDARALRGDIRYEDVTFGYSHGRPVLARHQPRHPRRRDHRLRRPLRRRQDDDLLAAAALLRGRRRARSPSTASTSAT